MFNCFILCYYIVFYVNNNITYDESNVLLSINLSMLFADIKQVICYKLELNYNDIKINKYYTVLI
jgi:hypothetical protein